jgi:hypothetical protein
LGVGIQETAYLAYVYVKQSGCAVSKICVICVLLVKNTKYVWLDVPFLGCGAIGITGTDDIDDAVEGRVRHLGFNAAQ